MQCLYQYFHGQWAILDANICLNPMSSYVIFCSFAIFNICNRYCKRVCIYLEASHFRYTTYWVEPVQPRTFWCGTYRNHMPLISASEYQEFLIYIKMLGLHMQSSGLLKVWTEDSWKCNGWQRFFKSCLCTWNYFIGPVADNSTTTFKMYSKWRHCYEKWLRNVEDYDALLLGFSQKINSAASYRILSTVIGQILILCFGGIIFRW